MNLVLPWGCLDNWVVVPGTDPGRGAATLWGFQTQGSRMAGLPASSFSTHALTKCHLRAS